MLSGSYDKRAIVWDVDARTVIKSYDGLHTAPVLDVDWQNNDTFATCSSDHTIHICSVSSAGSSSTRTLLGHKNEVNAVCWSPDGKLLASCSDDGTAKIWEPSNTSNTTGIKFDLVGHQKEIYTVRWTPGGPGSSNPDVPLYLCTASFDGSVNVWDSTTGKVVHSLRRHNQPVYSIAPSPNGTLLATGSLGGFVSVWDLRTGKIVRELRGNGDTFDVSWSFDGEMLSSCFSCGVVQVIDMNQFPQALLDDANGEDANGHDMEIAVEDMNNDAKKEEEEAEEREREAGEGTERRKGKEEGRRKGEEGERRERAS